MGAALSIQEIKAKDAAAVKVEFQRLQEQARWEYGHGGYTGTIAEARGVEVLSQEFEDQPKAWYHIEEHAQKWGPALAARIKGTDRWLLGGWFSE